MNSIQISKVQFIRITSETIVFSVLLLSMVNFSSNPVNYSTSNQVFDFESPRDDQPFRGKLSSIAAIHAYNDSLPIFINNNTDFNSTATSKGWEGNGSIINPFIINNLNITNSTSSIKLIEIINTDAFFEIKNCYLSNGTFGIRLQNVTHGKIYNNIIKNCSDRGMYIVGSKNNTISNNNVYGGEVISGSTIHLLKTNNSIISNNTIANYQRAGINIVDSKNNTLFNNIIRDGISNWSTGIELWNVNHSLVLNNSIYNNNGKGIESFYSLYNTFSYMYVFNNSDGGIYAGDSSYLTISNCHIFNNKRSGVFFSNTFHSIITNCVFYSNEYVALDLGSINIVSNCTVFKNDFIANMVSYFEDFEWRSLSFKQTEIQGFTNNITHNFYDTHTFPNTNSDEFVDSPMLVGGYPLITPGYIYDSFPLITPSNTIFSLIIILSIICLVQV